jgi:hypothetical protein
VTSTTSGVTVGVGGTGVSVTVGVGGIGVAEGSGVRVAVGVAAGVAPLQPLISHIAKTNNKHRDLGLGIGLSPG